MKNTSLPTRVDSSILAKLAQPGDPFVILIISGIGSTAPFEFRDKKQRYFILRWDTKHNGHVVRIPLPLWQRNNHEIALDIMDQPRQRLNLIVKIEGECQLVPTLEQVTAAKQAMEVPAESVEPQPHAPPPAVPYPEAENESVPVGDPDALMYGEMPLHEAVAKLVEDGPQRIKAVAAQLEADESDITLALTSSASAAEVASGGWVRIKD